MIPAPMPRPTLMTIRLFGRGRRWKVSSASAAAWLSLATTHRHAVAALDERPEAQVGPVEVHRPADGARAGVDDARRADADAEERRPVIGAQGVDELEDELDGGLAVAPFEGQMDGAQDVAAQVDDRAAELRVAEVEADQVTAVRGDAEQDR